MVSARVTRPRHPALRPALLFAALLLTGLLIGARPAAAESRFVDIAPPDGYQFEARDINNREQVVGILEGPGGGAQAAIWSRRDGLRVIDGLAAGGGQSAAFAINNRGAVVGQRSVAAGVYHAFVWSARDGVRDLGTLGGATSSASAISDRGVVVGQSDVSDGSYHAFVWTAGAGMRDINPPGAIASRAVAVNQRGEVAGVAVDEGENGRGFVWSARAGWRYLEGLNSDHQHVSDINDRGQVVGRLQFVGGASPLTQAVLWTGGRAAVIVDAGDFNEALAISKRGQVVGLSRVVDPEERQDAFLWSKGELRILDELAGYDLVPRAISDKGVIAGSYAPAAGEWHGFVLVP